MGDFVSDYEKRAAEEREARLQANELLKRDIDLREREIDLRAADFAGYERRMLDARRHDVLLVALKELLRARVGNDEVAFDCLRNAERLALVAYPQPVTGEKL